jgi:beta-1,4-glucosyltransferase
MSRRVRSAPPDPAEGAGEEVVAPPSPQADTVPGNLVNALVQKQRELAVSGSPVRVAWLNHYSIRAALADAADAVGRVDVCGIDGQFLGWLLKHPVRTSADVIVPLLVACDESIQKVLAIGGRDCRDEALSAALSDVAGRPIEVVCIDGFDGLLRGAVLQETVRAQAPDLLLVGLGAGLQEQVLLEGADAMTRGYAMTCGGFLDQVLQPGYYPSWAYPLRLNWLVRLAREPRRLWRRYTVLALRALVDARGWRRLMAGVPGVAAHAHMCASTLAGVPQPGS